MGWQRVGNDRVTKYSSHYLYILRNCHSEAVSIPTSGFGKVKGHVKRQGQGHLTLMSCFLVLETK